MSSEGYAYAKSLGPDWTDPPPAGANPHPPGSEEWKDWTRGWNSYYPEEWKAEDAVRT